jgi:hypothetical protein
MKISQSLLKDVLNGCCKHYFKMKYVDCIKIEPTTAMMKGLYFESELIGSARGGKFEYPKLQSGKKSKAEQDIDEIVNLAKEVIQNSGIKIDNVQNVLETDEFIGHVDFLSDKIYDVKFTGETFDRWNKSFIYNLKETMNIQARHYQLMKPGFDFVFLIFSEHSWFRAILYPYDENAIIEHEEKIRVAKERMKELEEPTSNKCAECRFNLICKNRVKIFEIEDINNLTF